MTSSKRKHKGIWDDNWLWTFFCLLAMLVAMGVIPVDHIRQNCEVPFFKRALIWLIALLVIGFFGFGVYSAFAAIF